MLHMTNLNGLPHAGQVFTNGMGGKCTIISVDKPMSNKTNSADNYQIAYRMGNGYAQCHTWKNVRKMLEYNGYIVSEKYTPIIERELDL